MARAASAPKKEISMEEALWKSADKLRGSVEPAEYKHVVLSLFFLKFASDKFEAQRKAISEKYGEKFVDNVAFYKMCIRDSYDTIFVGFPIWWYVAPTIINTFLESYDLTGKTIIPFATSGGSDIGKTNERLAPSCKGAKLVDGKVFKHNVGHKEDVYKRQVYFPDKEKGAAGS